jgi:hypothetical protein
MPKSGGQWSWRMMRMGMWWGDMFTQAGGLSYYGAVVKMGKMGKNGVNLASDTPYMGVGGCILSHLFVMLSPTTSRGIMTDLL